MNENLPAFVVLNSKFTIGNPQPINSRLWGSGFLSSQYAGVMLRSGADPVLYLNDPKGMDRDTRRAMLDAVDGLNEKIYRETADPETHARISQYEMAFRMQTSVPELADLSQGAEKHLGALRRGRPAAGQLRLQLPDGPPAGGAGRALHPGLQTRLGLARQLRGRSADALRGDRPGDVCAGHRSEAARHVGRHARHLGRRVRPHDLLARRPVAEELRPRPPRQVLQHVACRRRHQTRHRPRQDRRLLLHHHRKSASTSATWPPRSSVHSASTTSG